MASIIPSAFLSLGIRKTFSFPRFGATKHSVVPRSGRKLPAVRRSSHGEEELPPPPPPLAEEESNPKSTENEELSIFRPWDVPWDWKVTACVMMPYLMSTTLNGVVGLAGLEGSLPTHSVSMPSQLHGPGEIATEMFVDQLLKSVAKLTVLYMFVCPHQPFPPDIFTFRWNQPLSLRNGWILWAIGGLVVACLALLLVKILYSTSGVIQTPNETDPLVRLLPLIGASEVSTICLLGILGILAPVCEETIYRGFLLTSLTKWFSVPVSVTISSAVFALAHQSPGKSLEIFAFGTVLGLIYARTRNLLAPITMHAFWNSGVILFLTYLHLEGHEIQKYVL